MTNKHNRRPHTEVLILLSDEAMADLAQANRRRGTGSSDTIAALLRLFILNEESRDKERKRWLETMTERQNEVMK